MKKILLPHQKQYLGDFDGLIYLIIRYTWMDFFVYILVYLSEEKTAELNLWELCRSYEVGNFCKVNNSIWCHYLLSQVITSLASPVRTNTSELNFLKINNKFAGENGELCLTFKALLWCWYFLLCNTWPLLSQDYLSSKK